MKIALLLCCVSLAMLLHPVVSNESGPPFRIIDIEKLDIGYSYFDSMTITSREDFDAFLKETSDQLNWNNKQGFVDALVNAQVNFNQEALVLLRHDEPSGSVPVFETPVLQEKILLCEIRGKLLYGFGTGNMTNYCYALAVSKSLVNQVQLNAVLGFPERRPLPTVLLSLTERQPLKFSRRDPPPGSTPPNCPPRPTPPNCPKITIECPTGILETGKTYVVKVSVEGVNPEGEMPYGWSVSNGEILEGQGTRSLKIRIDDPNQEVTATVEVNGIDPYCSRVASCSLGG